MAETLYVEQLHVGHYYRLGEVPENLGGIVLTASHTEYPKGSEYTVGDEGITHTVIEAQNDEGEGGTVGHTGNFRGIERIIGTSGSPAGEGNGESDIKGTTGHTGN